jgi:outer membrane protein assembly factor BamB
MSTPPVDPQIHHDINPPPLSKTVQPPQKDPVTPGKPLRVWPGIVAVVLQLLLWFVVPVVAPDAAMWGMLGAVVCGLAVLVWWLFFSRAPWAERVGAIVLMVLAVIVTKRIVHPSIAGGGMGMLIYFYAIPALSVAIVLAATVSRQFSSGPRRLTIVATILLACGLFTVVRTGGISAEGHSDLHWRWTKTPEELLLAQAGDEPASPSSSRLPVSSSTQQGDANSSWSGFRGSARDGIVRGVRIATNWSQQPPVEIWRRPIGPGWSSFAVRDNLFYTQEQRGNDELVSCYNLTNGKPVWVHRDPARFWESNAGAGPRGTPTISNGRVYTLGATGIVNALDAQSGAVVWSRNAASDTKTKVPTWGFASSPLVVGDVVVVATAGALVGYDILTGNQRWLGPTTDRGGYSSPHLATIGGVVQVLLVNGEGAMSVNPKDGTLLWKHGWEGDSIVQPAVTSDGDVLIGSGSGLGAEVGLRRVAVANGPNGWTAGERWTSIGLKPYFNDFVLHKDHGFGFDGSALACIDLKNGERKWKGGHYGHGQIVLLSDQDLLLVLSESGELALVQAIPDQFTEVARIKAVEGKTWNHPVVVGDVLLVRNDHEMVAFRMSPASS